MGIIWIIMKVKNEQIFQAAGDTWSTWIPDGMTIHVFISPDSVEGHFAEIGEESTISGPNVFQCMGFNNHSFFKLTGLGKSTLDILV